MKPLNILHWLKKRIFVVVLSALITTACNTAGDQFQSNLSQAPRFWIGPTYWANPLQDWRVNQGMMECLISGGDRNVYLLTHELSQRPGDFTMQVNLGRLDTTALTEGWVGFKIGIKGEFNDYRDSAVRGEGLPAGITNSGTLFIGSANNSHMQIPTNLQDLTLKVKGEVMEGRENDYILHLQVFESDTDNLLGEVTKSEISSEWMEGGVALVCHAGVLPEIGPTRTAKEYPDWGFEPQTQRQGNVRFWFKNWTLEGSKVLHHAERSWGPILFTQFTINQNQLKLTAQLTPGSAEDSDSAYMEVQSSGSWQRLLGTSVDPLSRTATFGPISWDQDTARTYRIVYTCHTSGNGPSLHYYDGVIPASPENKDEIVLAAFTGNNDLGFPNSDLVENVRLQNPDFLFFSGDQIYEGVGGYGVQRSPLAPAILDYLRKWYLFGWAYGDLLKRIPVVTIPDDHDVYHGNIWGDAGKATDSAATESGKQDTGGYKMPAPWVNMVQRTQTSHLPAPFDDTPVKQNIGVYYTNIDYAGLSLAVLEDRKFKSPPKALLPAAQVDNGWAQNADFNAAIQADHPDAVLLGSRQLEFLEHWSQNWGEDVWMKVVLSQTIFANLATLPEEESNHDRIVPKLRILKAQEYAPNDIPVADMDSNGWPQSGRNRALEIIRKAFALHIAGDQHLGSTLQYGIDDFGDAGYAICVPSVSNVWPRRWYPASAEKDRDYTGDFQDGFGNHMTVLAVSNPLYTGRTPAKLYDRATGYGIVRFRKKHRQMVLENWPRDAHPQKGKPYNGWPVIINQMDNFNPKNGLRLPMITAKGLTGSMVKVTDEQGTHTLSIRAHGDSLQLKVPQAGSYSVNIVPLAKESIGLKLETLNTTENLKTVELEL